MKQPQKGTQLAQNPHAALELRYRVFSPCRLFQLPGIGKAIERGQQLVQRADGATGVEIVRQAIEKRRAQAGHFIEERARRRSGIERSMARRRRQFIETAATDALVTFKESIEM